MSRQGSSYSGIEEKDKDGVQSNEKLSYKENGTIKNLKIKTAALNEPSILTYSIGRETLE